jgi:hypothetical protein
VVIWLFYAISNLHGIGAYPLYAVPCHAYWVYYVVTVSAAKCNAQYSFKTTRLKTFGPQLVEHLAEGCRQILGGSPVQCQMTSVDIIADKIVWVS